ncbi:MAG: hypothetical protein AAB662_02845 [Patescibacteria group bacterium]
MPDQEERKQGSAQGPKRFIDGISNTYGAGRTVFGLGRVAATAIFSADPVVWIVIGVIVGLLSLVFLMAMTAAPTSFSPTSPTVPTPSPLPTQTP